MTGYFQDPDAMWREEDPSPSGADDGSEDVASIILAHGRMLSLNELGTEVWKRCDGRGVAQMVEELAAVFDVEPAELEADVVEFLQGLVAQGVVHER